jgi:1-acyl-sn-glycerol-3-phosphate acyltransferase
MVTTIIPERSRPAAAIVRLLSMFALSPFFKINVRGAGNIPEKESFVLLPKHQRWEDIPLIAISIERPLYFVAKQELFNNFLSKKIIPMLGGLPLDRNRPNRSRFTILKVLQKLEQKEGIVIFPEGTYYKNHMGPGYTGFIRMIYSKVNTLFVPAGIQYCNRNGRIQADIKFGNPVGSKELCGKKKFRSLIMEEIARLSGLIYS